MSANAFKASMFRSTVDMLKLAAVNTALLPHANSWATQTAGK
jgi:hypothetical protein